MLVTLEGLDGSGKTTAWEGLKARHPDGIFTREPTDSWYGEAVRRSVDDREADPVAELFLYCADHADHVSRTIRPGLERGRLVVSDRYVDSRIAYQGVTLGGRVEDPIAYVRAIHRPISPTPDLTCYLDIDVEMAMRRCDGSTKFERRAFLEAVDGVYRRLIEADPERFVVIDAEADIDAVVDAIDGAIAARR